MHRVWGETWVQSGRKCKSVETIPRKSTEIEKNIYKYPKRVTLQFFFFSRLPEIREPKLEWDYRDRNRMRHGGAIAHLQQRFPKLGDLLDQISSLLNPI